MITLAFLAFVFGLSLQSSTSEPSTQGAPGAPYYYENWCDGHNLKYLDDSQCAKVFPSSYDREFTCDVSVASPGSLEKLSSMGFAKEQPLSSMTASQIDVSTLPAIGVSPNVRACVVVTKRIQSESGGIELYNKFLCNGNTRLCDIACAGRSTDLIINNGNLTSCLRQASHCFNKVIAVRRNNPGRSQYRICTS